MGKLAEIKTKETKSSVADFINSISPEQKQKDCSTFLKLIKKITKEEPKMWGASIIGFGNMIYKSPATGREVAWFKIGFSPRKANFSLFPISIESQSGTLQKLGKHKTGGGCLYINKLEDVDLKVLEAIISSEMKNK